MRMTFLICLFLSACFQREGFVHSAHDGGAKKMIGPMIEPLPLPALDRTLKGRARPDDEVKKFLEMAACPDRSGDIAWYGGPEGSMDKEWRKWFLDTHVATTLHIRTWKYSTEDGSEEYAGTGIVIDLYGRTITARHVVENADYIMATRRFVTAEDHIDVSDRSFPMRVVRSGKRKDVALIEPIYQERFEKSAEWDPNHVPEKCQPVWQLGVTTGWSRGFISALDGAYRRKVAPIVRVAMKGAPGDSGAPVLNDQVDLVGILIVVDITKPKGSYFVPIRDVLKDLGIR